MEVYLKPFDIANLCDPRSRPGRNTYTVKCPTHNDSSASLSISAGRKATVMHCHAGCSTLDVLEALEVSIEQLYHNYDPTTPHTPDATLTLTEMKKRRVVPDRWELSPHESLQDVLYEVFDVSPESWATVYVRWERELLSPFTVMWAQPLTVEAICRDLLSEVVDKGYLLSVDKQHEMMDKIFDEWEVHK